MVSFPDPASSLGMRLNTSLEHIFPCHMFAAGNFEDFWTVNKKMMLNARAEHEPFRNVPFCIYQVCSDDCNSFSKKVAVSKL